MFNLKHTIQRKSKLRLHHINIIHSININMMLIEYHSIFFPTFQYTE